MEEEKKPANIEALMKQGEELKKQVAEVSTIIKYYKEKNIELEIKLAKYEDCIPKLTAEANKIKAKYEDINSERQKLRAEKEKLGFENEDLRVALTAFQKSYAGMDYEENHVKRIIEDMKKEYSDLKKRLKGEYEREIAIMENNCFDLKKELEGSKKKYSTLENSVKEKDIEITQLKKELFKENASFSSLELAYKKLKENETTEEEKATKMVDTQIGNFSMIKDLKEENIKYAEKTVSLEKTNADYKLKIKSLKKLAIVLGIGISLALGYAAYDYTKNNLSVENRGK